MEQTRQKKNYFTVALIFNEVNSKMLLIHHKKMQLWLPAGGKIEENEYPSEAVLREVKEELGVDAEIIEFNSSTEIVNTFEKTIALPFCILTTKNFKNKESDEFTDIHFAYTLKVKSENLVAKEDEISEFRWFTKEEIKELNTFESVKTVAEKVMV